MGAGAAAALLLPASGALAAPDKKDGDRGRHTTAARENNAASHERGDRPDSRWNDRGDGRRYNDRNDRGDRRRDNDRNDCGSRRGNDRGHDRRSGYGRPVHVVVVTPRPAAGYHHDDRAGAGCSDRDRFVGHAQNVDRIDRQLDIYISGVGTYHVEVTSSTRVTYNGRRASFQDLVGGHPTRFGGAGPGGATRAVVIHIAVSPRAGGPPPPRAPPGLASSSAPMNPEH